MTVAPCFSNKPRLFCCRNATSKNRITHRLCSFSTLISFSDYYPARIRLFKLTGEKVWDFQGTQKCKYSKIPKSSNDESKKSSLNLAMCKCFSKSGPKIRKSAFKCPYTRPNFFSKFWSKLQISVGWTKRFLRLVYASFFWPAFLIIHS